MPSVRCLNQQDLPSLLFLERKSFVSSWTEQQLANQLDHSRGLSLGCFDGDLKGFVLISTVLDEAEILQIAVDPERQGEGLARTLLDTAIVYLKVKGVNLLMLEVRESNMAAVSLYRSYGFIEDGLRKGYYPSLQNDGAREDALLFSYRF